MKNKILEYLKNKKLEKIDTILSFYFIFLFAYTVIFFIILLLEKNNILKAPSMDEMSNITVFAMITYFALVVIGFFTFPTYITLKIIDIKNSKEKEREENIRKITIFISGAIACLLIWALPYIFLK